MIDNMVTLLGKEQGDDDAQKSMCDKEFEESADHKTETEEAIAASEANIAEMEESSATLASEIATLQDEIKALDKAVADATEQRKNESRSQAPAARGAWLPEPRGSASYGS